MRTIRVMVLEEDGTPRIMVIPGGEVHVLTDDDAYLFTIRDAGQRAIDISAGAFCRDKEGMVLDTELNITPESRRTVRISRPEYK